MTGIICLPLVPVRESDSERSEMSSQLLFGERVEIIEERERWLYVRNLSDNYAGWVDRKMVQLQTVEEALKNSKSESYCVSTPILECQNKFSEEKLLLPGGSYLQLQKESEISVNGNYYRFNPTNKSYSEKKMGEQLVLIAKQYLQAPYLWGGKSIMGIDCSGLVQVVYSICGIQLPRDASQQVDAGFVIDFLSEAQPGDLAFFENAEGKITHVGILIDAQRIIHASGWVKIESIDTQGIISAQTGEYTHKLRVIKRVTNYNKK